MISKCREFEDWLDDGRPAVREAAATVHAAGCERCRAALASVRSVEAALALPADVPAPAGFTDAVMQRVGAAEAQRAQGGEASWRRLLSPPRFSLCLRFLLQPEVVASVLFFALAAWQWSSIFSLASRLGPELALQADAVSRALAGHAIEVPASLRVLASPSIMLGVVAGALPLFLWFSWQLGRWSERAFATPRLVGLRPR